MLSLNSIPNFKLPYFLFSLNFFLKKGYSQNECDNSSKSWNEQWLELVKEFASGTTKNKLLIAHKIYGLTRKFEREASEIGKVKKTIFCLNY